ncbi:uncharacterized protein SOCE26_031280 [Sorangium cellulosum]|uniref:Uncharacterized protein n=1 Tax=Sorangium cellulosum TaxID=56 RepID=A0A2L0EQY7_SORCE|nr:uncharacterized protein SOCE26_031280 [Sorangium cellulosum]
MPEVSRFIAGTSQPRLPDVLALVDATTERLLDFLALFVHPGQLPSVARDFRVLEERRRIATELPWSHAVLRVLELAGYAALPCHDDAWVAARLGLPDDEVRVCREALSRAGLIRWREGSWRTRASPIASRWWRCSSSSWAREARTGACPSLPGLASRRAGQGQGEPAARNPTNGQHRSGARASCRKVRRRRDGAPRGELLRHERVLRLDGSDGVGAERETERRVLRAGELDDHAGEPRRVARLLEADLLRVAPDLARSLRIIVDDLSRCHDGLRLQELRSEVARLEDRHRDAERRELRVQRLRDRLDGELRRAVNAEPRPRPVAAHRREVQDQAGALLPELRKHGARHREEAEHVRLEDAPHLVALGLLDRADDAVAGVVHQHIDPAEPSDGSLDRGGDGRLVRHVERKGEESLRPPEAVRDAPRIARGGDHPIAGGERRVRDLRADSARCSRDEPNTLVLARFHGDLLFVVRGLRPPHTTEDAASPS